MAEPRGQILTSSELVSVLSLERMSEMEEVLAGWILGAWEEEGGKRNEI